MAGPALPLPPPVSDLSQGKRADAVAGAVIMRSDTVNMTVADTQISPQGQGPLQYKKGVRQWRRRGRDYIYDNENIILG